MTSRVRVFSNHVPRSDCTISGLAMFCTSMPTRRERTRIAGTMGISIHSRSSWIPLQALPLCDSRTIPSISTIKASDNLPFIEDSLNNYFNIDPSTNFIRMVNQRGPTNTWKEALPITNAVKGSSFAVVRSPDSDANKIVSRIYYQDPELRLRERYCNHLGTTDQWVLGEQSYWIISIHYREPITLQVTSTLVYSHMGPP
jgi:hypothetical protein